MPFMRRVLILLTFLMTISPAHAGVFGPSNFDECILDKMQGVTSNTAASAIWLACRNKFPAGKPTEPQSSHPEPKRTADGRTLEEVAGELVGNYWENVAMIGQCTVTRNGQDSYKIKDKDLKSVNEMAWDIATELIVQNSNIVDGVEQAVVQDRISRGLPATLENVKDQAQALRPNEDKVAKGVYDKYVHRWGSHAAGCKKLLPFIESNMSLMDSRQADLKFVLGPKFYLYKFKLSSYGDEIKE